MPLVIKDETTMVMINKETGEVVQTFHMTPHYEDNDKEEDDTDDLDK